MIRNDALLLLHTRGPTSIFMGSRIVRISIYINSLIKCKTYLSRDNHGRDIRCLHAEVVQNLKHQVPLPTVIVAHQSRKLHSGTTKNMLSEAIDTDIQQNMHNTVVYVYDTFE